MGTQVDAVGNPVKVNKLRGKTNTTLAPVYVLLNRDYWRTSVTSYKQVCVCITLEIVSM